MIRGLSIGPPVPGFPLIPETVAPAGVCPECESLDTEVRHKDEGGGIFSATLQCNDCGSIFELMMTSYRIGLVVGAAIQAARS